MEANPSAWERVFELAERGRFSTSPNPRVGALLLAGDGSVVGEGWHERAGGPHAEVSALRAAGSAARGATLLLNLEPCAHHGRTPPCADALIAAGVARVVCSLEDPDPRVAGAGLQRLRDAGVAVEVGAERERAERLNEPFLVSVRKRRPYVHLKWAMSLDGKTGTRTGASKWITGEEARADAMRLREECDAVLVGAGTVLADDPRLSRRLGLNSAIVPYRRIVLDGRLRVTPEAQVFDRAGGETWLVTARAAAATVDFEMRGVNVRLLPRSTGRRTAVDLELLLGELHALEVRSLLVEGGGETAACFLERGLVDRVTAYVAPLLVGGASAPSPLGGKGPLGIAEALRLEDLTVERLGRDLRLSGRVPAR